MFRERCLQLTTIGEKNNSFKQRNKIAIHFVFLYSYNHSLMNVNTPTI